MAQVKSGHDGADSINVVFFAAVAAAFRYGEHVFDRFVSGRLVESRKRSGTVADENFGFFGVGIIKAVGTDGAMGNVVVFESFNGGKQADERVLELFGAADVQFGFATLENFAVGDFIDESQIARFFGQPGNNAEFDKFHQTAAFDGFDIRENGRARAGGVAAKQGKKTALGIYAVYDAKGFGAVAVKPG